MSGNNCDEPLQQIRELQEQNRKLQDKADEIERQMRAAGIYSTAAKGNEVILPGPNGPRVLDTADIQRGYKQLAGTMSSPEVDDLIARGFDNLARPMGADGRFVNYDRLLREVETKTVQDYARMVEALGITMRRNTPDDHAFITQKYDRERLIGVVSNYYRELGASNPDILARAAAKTAPLVNAVENKVWLRFWADRSVRLTLDAVEQMRDYMRAIPGDKVPDELTQEAFKHYKLAKVLHRHNVFVKRRHAQALRSEQEDILNIEQFRLNVDEEKEIEEIIGLTLKDVDKDEFFGRVLDAIDNRDEKQLNLLIDTAKIDGIDPKAGFDKDWFNTHMRMANGLIKDSQLGNLQTQLRMNVAPNAAMMVFGPLQQTFENGMKLTPVGTQLTRRSLLEAAQISAEAHQFAWGVMKATWKRDLSRVFQEGVSNFSGNIDTYGKRLLTNNQELADMQEILDMPYKPAANPLVAFMQPENAALFTNKLQTAMRILAFTKPRGAKEFNRFEAAYLALSLGDTTLGRQRLRVGDIDTFVPWKPYLRGMAAVDEVFGKYQFLFKLKADLEVKARMEGAQLGLLDDQDRAAWVQRQLDEAIYSNTPAESDIKAFRKLHGLRGSDFTDDEIAALLAEANMAGAPTLNTPEGVAAMEYSAKMRFQNTPQGGIAEKIDQGVMNARQTWWVDRYVIPYWRSMFNGLTYNWPLATGGIADTVRMIGGNNPSPELIRSVKGGWIATGALFGAFGMLDAAGLITGGNEPDIRKRNTIKGPLGPLYLGGLPVADVLFLWKDVKDALVKAGANEYDGNEAWLAAMKVGTNFVLRQGGIQQLQLLLDLMLDGSQGAYDRMQRFVAFVGSGQIPFIGHLRELERINGITPREFYRDARETPSQDYLLNKDDPTAPYVRFLRNLAYDTSGLVAAATGAKRMTTDHLGSPRRGFDGAQSVLQMLSPYGPVLWPSGKINETVYPELEAQDLLDAPQPLLKRVLEGIAMSDDLQEEYNAIHGTIKGDPQMPPTARLGIAGKKVQAYFPLPIETVSGKGFRFRDGEAVSLEISEIIDKLTAGKTKKEAFYALFTSPVYQAMEDNPISSANPPGGLPKTERRKRTAQLLINAVTAYYDLLTQDELERRAAAGTSPHAKQWSDAKTALADQTFKRSEERSRVEASLLNPVTGAVQ